MWAEVCAGAFDEGSANTGYTGTCACMYVCCIYVHVYMYVCNMYVCTVCAVLLQFLYAFLQGLAIGLRIIFTAQLAGEARQLGCPKIVLDHVRVYIYIYIFIYVCALWISSLLVVYDAIDNASSSRATRTEN